MLEHYQSILPRIDDGDLRTIAAPLDFLGVNYYSRTVVRAGTDPARPIAVDVPEVERTEMGWEVYPDGLKDLLVRLHRDYVLPDVYITENGAAYPDARNNGSVADPKHGVRKVVAVPMGQGINGPNRTSRRCLYGLTPTATEC